MEFGWLVGMDHNFLIKKALWSLSHPVGFLQPFLCLLFLSRMNTTCSMSAMEVRFFSPLYRPVMLCMDYPPEDKDSPVIEVTWRKLGDKPSLILKHLNNKSECFGKYCRRIKYYFQNNTLILDNTLEEDDGVYEVSLLYQNNSVWTKKLKLSIIMPPPPPSIKVDMNNSSTTLVLKCEVERGTNLSYHWLKSGQLLPQDERHFLVENSVLQVNNLTSADCVNYTCVAANGPTRSEGHIQINGSVVEMCSKTPTSALSLKIILSIAAVASCAFGLCVMIFCFRRELLRWMRGGNIYEQPGNSRRGRRRMTDEADMRELSVYDDIWEAQISPAAQEVVRLTCVYTDFIPNCPTAESAQRPVQVDDYGYSTIE